MKKSVILLTVLLFVSSAFAEITLNSDPIQIGQRNFSFSSRDLLYDQISNPSTDGVIAAQDFVDPSFDSYDCWGADDFEIPAGETWNIDAMDVLGGYWNGAGPGTGFGNLKIYEDAPGMPGTELFDVPACVAVDDGLGNLNITLSSVVTLTEGVYWVAWQYTCEFASGGQWGWQPHTDQYGTEFYWINPGGGFGGSTDWISSYTQWPAFEGHDLSFALYGTIGGGTTADFTIDLTDDYGDGWNGGMLDVIVAGVLVLDDITVASGFGPVTYVFTVADGDLVELLYTPGSWAYENAYYVYDNIGNFVISSGDGGVEPDAYVSFTAVIAAGAHLEGYVYESGTTNPIENAEVEVAGATDITDNTGYYLIENAAPGTWDATASHPDYFPETVSVVLTAGVTTTQDFGLEWAEISVDPLSFDISILPDATADEIITITNWGPHELTYNAGLNFISDRTYEPVIKHSTRAIDHSQSETNPRPGNAYLNSSYTDALFDLQFQYPVGVGGGEAGVECDGNYIYTTKWNGDLFYKYELDGTYIGEFTVPGADHVRDLAYDGQYFYGAAGNTTVFIMDFDTQTLIGTITAPVAVRGIAYDEAANGFWANNWSTDITLFDMTGAYLNSFACQTYTSFYGFAYDNFSVGGPFLWGNSQDDDCTLVQFDIATGLETGVVCDVTAITGSAASAGGSFISDAIVSGFATLGIMQQNEFIVGLELCATESWMAITNNGSGVVPGGGGSVDVTVHFDAAGLAFGTVKTAEVIINHDAVTGGPEVLPVTMTVEEGGTPIPAVFFSEYIEGSSNNKGLEIYNNTGAAINLDDYRINQSVNGGGWEYQHYFPTGATLEDGTINGDTWAICTDQADPVLQAVADEILAYPSVVHHNGDDARGLEWTSDGGTTWILIDVIGIPTEDPGDGWDVAGELAATKDHTLVRKDAVTTGNTDWLLSAGTDPTDSEWIVYPQDTFDYFGWHIIEPAPPLDPPQNLVVTETGYATWDPPAGGGDLFELTQHDGNANNAYYQDYGYGYGVVYDLSGYTNVTVEMVDFRHSPWGIFGIWDYSIHIVDWDTHTEIVEVTGLQTTGDDTWELEIDLGSVSASGLVGIFMEPMSNSPTDAYPCMDADGVTDGASYYGDLVDYSAFGLSTVGDFLMDLWIMGEATDEMVRAPRFAANFGNGNARVRTKTPSIDFITLNQTVTSRDFLGYNVYLDGVDPVFTTDEFYQYTGLVNGTTYLAEVTAVYDEGESDPIGETFTYIDETFDPPTNVAVNPELGIVTWLPPSTSVFFDNFDSYTAGQYLCTQTTDWVPWSGTPGGNDDAYVSDEQANSTPNSVKIEGAASDIVHMFGNLTTGHYMVSFQYYVAAACGGYFNLMHDFTGESRDDLRNEWAIESYFASDGSGYINAGGSSAATFTYPNGAWFECRIDIDLDNDLAEYYVNGNFVHGWQWSLQATGSAGMCQLGVVDFFAAAPTGDTVTYFFDDFTFAEVSASRELTGYNVYLDEMLGAGYILQGYTTDLEYELIDLVENNTYIAGVSAVYDDPGESEIIGCEFTYTPATTFYPPENLVGTVVNYNEVELVWEQPGGVTGEWIHWDDGMNGQSIGLTSGGDFMVASRWDPAAIAPFDGMELTKVNFFPCCDQSSYTIKVWTGANAANLVYEQVLASIVVSSWNEITLDTPVVINAADEFWFGYAIIGQPVGTHPAGCDVGPAIAGYGDMITLDGVTWDPLSSFGLDYNWNLQGYVLGSDGETIAFNPTPRVQTSTVRTQRLSQSSPFSCSQLVKRVNELPARDSRSLSGYKVYRDGEEIEEITDPLILTYLDDEGLDAGDYEYYVTAIYTDPAGESEASNLAPITITLPPPVNATAVCENPPNVVVSWELPPMPVRGLSHYKVYCDGEEIADNINNLFYIHTNVEPGEYIYNVTAVYDVAWESEFSNDAPCIVPVGADGLLIPLITKLTGNYPNPFNPETNIAFSLKEAGKVTLEIYNIKGEKVRTLLKGHLDAAYHNIIWNGKDNSGKKVASGVYFYKMKTGKYVSTKKMILMK